MHCYCLEYAHERGNRFPALSLQPHSCPNLQHIQGQGHHGGVHNAIEKEAALAMMSANVLTGVEVPPEAQGMQAFCLANPPAESDVKMREKISENFDHTIQWGINYIYSELLTDNIPIYNML